MSTFTLQDSIKLHRKLVWVSYLLSSLFEILLTVWCLNTVMTAPYRLWHILTLHKSSQYHRAPISREIIVSVDWPVNYWVPGPARSIDPNWVYSTTNVLSSVPDLCRVLLGPQDTPTWYLYQLWKPKLV